MNRYLARVTPWLSGIGNRLRPLGKRAERLLPRAEAGDWTVFLIALAGVVFCAWWLLSREMPATLAEVAELMDGTRRKYREFIAPGLWYGAIVHLMLWIPLLLMVRVWPKGGTARFLGGPDGLESQRHPSNGRYFWTVLALIVIVAAAVRWTRMDLSYWGDEGWAVTRYSHGNWRPMDRSEPQGEMRFFPALWDQAFFDDTTGGNHYLFTVVQRLTLDTWRTITGLPRESFDETISRLPSLIAGLACLPLLACMLRWWGRPRVGLWAAFFLAAHPMHLRYSSEARGYALMLCYLLAMIWFAALALQSGHWRWWLFFAVAELLAVYSWKGVYYGLGVTNAAIFFMILFGKVDPATLTGSPQRARWVAAGRWLMANLLAFGVFVHLLMPCIMQTPEAMRAVGGRPMDGTWLRQELAQVFTGTPWQIDPENPSLVAVARLWRHYPVVVWTLFAGYAAVLAIGIVTILRQCPRLGVLCGALIVSCVIGALHFKYKVHAEWQTWYSFYILPAICITAAFGVAELTRQSGRWLRGRASWITGTAVAAAVLLMAAPQTVVMASTPLEANREAFELTRGQHEPWGYREPSNIFTVYLWRHIALYDPRADTRVRDGAALATRIEEVKKAGGELYVVMGERELSRVLSGDMVEMLEDPALFTLMKTFYSQDPALTLRAYHYTGPR